MSKNYKEYMEGTPVTKEDASKALGFSSIEEMDWFYKRVDEAALQEKQKVEKELQRTDLTKEQKEEIERKHSYYIHYELYPEISEELRLKKASESNE